MRGDTHSASGGHERELANRAAMLEDLSRGRLIVRSRPDEAHVQFSTHCNMSCVMCWNGHNPPIRDMSPELLERLGEQLGDALAVLIPHDGSEPTARMWSEACDFARRHGLRMHLTTNVQGLSEPRLRDALDVVHSLDLSVDSHRPDVLERIRPGARTRSILRNLPRILAVADEAGIECEINVVFMTLNADHLAETLDHFADLGARAVSIIRLVDINGACAEIDPMRHLTRDLIDRIHHDCSTVARQRSMRLRWLVDDPDQEPEGAAVGRDEPDRDEAWGDLERVVPGFCRFVHSGVRVSVDGEVTPCGYAGTQDLQLGNLAVSDLPQIWNGPTAQDLRRAMYTRDLPRPCDTCQHAQYPPVDGGAPMLRSLGEPDASVSGDLEVVGPEHMHRAERAPTVVIRGAGPLPSSVGLLIAHGRTSAPRRWELGRIRSGPDVAEYQLGCDLWESLRPNQGYWWVLCTPGPDRRDVPIGDAARCIVRHQDLARIDRSRLHYPDHDGDGAEPDTDGSPPPVRVDLGSRPPTAPAPSPAHRRRLGGLISATLARVRG